LQNTGSLYLASKRRRRKPNSRRHGTLCPPKRNRSGKTEVKRPRRTENKVERAGEAGGEQGKQGEAGGAGTGGAERGREGKEKGKRGEEGRNGRGMVQAVEHG